MFNTRSNRFSFFPSASIFTTRPANTTSLKKTMPNYLAIRSAKSLCARAAFSTASASETFVAGAALKPAKSQRNINSFVKPRARDLIKKHCRPLPCNLHRMIILRRPSNSPRGYSEYTPTTGKSFQGGVELVTAPSTGSTDARKTLSSKASAAPAVSSSASLALRLQLLPRLLLSPRLSTAAPAKPWIARASFSNSCQSDPYESSAPKGCSAKMSAWTASLPAAPADRGCCN